MSAERRAPSAERRQDDVAIGADVSKKPRQFRTDGVSRYQPQHLCPVANLLGAGRLALGALTFEAG
jgi:hypothetical protein